MSDVELRTHRLHWCAVGDPAAPPVLLTMGLGLCSAAWDTLPERLAAAGFRAVSFDNRGLGRSTAPRGLFGIGDLADDAAAVLDAAGVATAHVFGISMGGMIAQELALRHPARVRALALGATFAGHLRSRKPSLAAARDLLLVSLRSGDPRRMARLLVSDAYYAANADRFHRYLARLSPASRWVTHRQLLAIARHEAARRLGTVRAPTLIITGNRDRLVPAENALKLSRLIPGARVVVLSGAGHAFPFEQPDETVALLAAHFRAYAAAARERPRASGG